MNELGLDRVSVLVAHRLPLVAAGLAAALGECDRFDVTAGHAALAWSRVSPPPGMFDVVLADHERALRWLGELRAARLERAEAAPRILVVSESDRESDVCAAIKAGVHGYLLMDCELGELLASVDLLSRGSRYLCAGVASRMAESLTHEPLTQRETDVLLLMVQGCSNKLIAARLGIALGTVKAHAKSIFGKLGVGTRTQAVALAAQRGLLRGAALRDDDAQPIGRKRLPASVVDTTRPPPVRRVRPTPQAAQMA